LCSIKKYSEFLASKFLSFLTFKEIINPAPTTTAVNPTTRSLLTLSKDKSAAVAVPIPKVCAVFQSFILDACSTHIDLNTLHRYLQSLFELALLEYS
tara:strand:- start:1300 stop:1590 length:291 start_codon:yes stop_codon:yes gene_type:complete